MTGDNAVHIKLAADSTPTLYDQHGSDLGPVASNLFQVATVTLTNAQVKALPTTPQLLVAAPGANKVIVPVLAYLYSNIVAPYTGLDADGMSIIFSMGNQTPLSLSDDKAGAGNPSDATDLLTGSLYAVVPPPYLLDTSIRQIRPVMGNAGGVNHALNIEIGNGGNLTGGDTANTLKVAVYYTVLDLS